MKYIRTKDEIIYVGDLIEDEFGNYCKAETIETDIEIDGKNIIKKADNIQDLCDDFVYVFENTTNILFGNYEALNNHFFDPSKIFGAIWTNKGLIYVAKMNDKGELELL